MSGFCQRNLLSRLGFLPTNGMPPYALPHRPDQWFLASCSPNRPDVGIRPAINPLPPQKLIGQHIEGDRRWSDDTAAKSCGLTTAVKLPPWCAWEVGRRVQSWGGIACYADEFNCPGSIGGIAHLISYLGTRNNQPRIVVTVFAKTDREQ